MRRVILFLLVGLLSVNSQAADKVLSYYDLVNGVDEPEDVKSFTIYGEMAVGGCVALQIIREHGGLWHDAPAVRQLTLLGRAIAKYSDRPELTYRFGVLNDGEVGAYSAPGGYIFITKGAYDACANYEQLGALLAHEIVHVSRRDALEVVATKDDIPLVTQIANNTSGDIGRFDRVVKRVSERILEDGYSSGNEMATDREARDLAYIAGFKYDALLNLLETARRRYGEGVFPRSPSVGSRIDALSRDQSDR